MSKNKKPLQLISIIFALLSWTFHCSFSYAQDTTYYAFVMQKRSGEQWQIPQGELQAGEAYRFQIVIYDNQNQTHVAVRGEFGYGNTNQWFGINARRSLDENNTHQDNDPDFSIWSENTTWKPNVRDQILQPLIDKGTGNRPDPKFLEFLIKQDKEESWSSSGKNYYFYRLHRLQADDFENDDFKKALSRFINPAENPTTDIDTIKGWVNEQDAFTKAKYVATPDAAHKEFYADFKEWFNNSLTATTPEPEIKKDAETSDQSFERKLENDDTTLLWKIVYILLGAIVIVAMIFAAWFFSQKFKDSKTDEDELDDEPKSKSPKKFLSPKERQKKSLKKVQPVPSVSRKEFDSLTKQLQQVVQQRVQNSPEPIAQVNRTESAMRPDEVRQIVAEELRFMMAEEFAKQFDNQVSRLLQSSAFQKAIQAEINVAMTQINTYLNKMFKEVVDNKLEKSIKQLVPELLTQNVSRLLQESAFQKAIQAEINVAITQLNTHEKLKEVIDNQLDNHIKQQLNPFITEHERFKESVEQKLENAVKQYWEHWEQFSQEWQQKLDELKSQAIESTVVNQPEPESHDDESVPQLVNDEMIDKLKNLFLSMKLIDESALNTLNTSVEPCIFVTFMIGYLKPNQSITNYQQLNSGLQELTQDQISLILPNIGDDIRLDEHHIMTQQKVSKGKLNVVIALLRPGVKCDNVVKRKAEIIEGV